MRKTSAAFEAQTLSLSARRNPRKSYVGNEVVVVVETADIAVAAREKHFDDLAFVALERDILEELSRLVARNGMTRPSNVARAIRRDIKPDSRVNSVPETEVGNGHAKLVEPGSKVPRDKRTAREAEKKHFRRNAIFRQRLVVSLEPPPRRAECRPPVNACDPTREIRAEMRPKACFKVELLPHVGGAEVAEPRNVRYLARNALPRPLEKHAEIHDGGL